MGPADQPHILADLQSRDPARESTALRTLINVLLGHAARELGARRSFVNAQAESVVAHAVARELAEGAAAYQKFANDEQLYGRLHLAVTHRIKELLRSRKENALHLEQAGGRGADDKPGIDPAADGIGPKTFVAQREHRSRLDALNEESRTRLLGATPAADHALVQLAVFEGRRSDAVAAELGISADSVRMRMTRLRRRLRECLLGPVLAQLGDDDRALVEALFIERVDLELLSAPAEDARGETAAVLAQRVSQLVRVSLVESLGDEGVVYLMRLLGKPKRGS
jgi:DNA-directed RNA polymerase specialized sigma24 family protein